MQLDADQCFDALRARDRRFDGRFFVGVSSTGIYCRPVCAVRTPRRENCHFFPSAAAAEKAGFRPCLRCRPELAPGWGLPDIAGRLAQAAAALIEQGFLDHAGTEQLAARVGVSARHLRRLFRAEFGVSMLELAQTQRLLLAKQCLTQTTLPVSHIAMACGFGSQRRFHALLRQRWGLRAQQIRRGASSAGPDTLELALAYRPPLAWQAWLEQAAAQAVPGIEHVDAGRYARTVRLRGRDAVCEGWMLAWNDAARCTLRVRASASLAAAMPQLLARLRRMFDLGASPQAVDARLGDLAAGAPGIRVPGHPDGFETLARSLLLRRGERAVPLLARMVDAFAAPPLPEAMAAAPVALSRCFPSAEELAARDEPQLQRIGVPADDAAALLHCARELCAARLELQPWSALETTLGALRAAPGMDEPTVQRVAMQALGWPDAFASADPGLLEQAERWRPWRAYAAMHLARRAARGGQP
jgi:AraC family transcriptional regulator of adaptative response / DNA-3-methyladenine glycosylase II